MKKKLNFFEKEKLLFKFLPLITLSTDYVFALDFACRAISMNIEFKD
jgi:hypothetical protein